MEYPKVYKYIDYREFLRDMFDYKKRMNGNFSHRLFAGKAGFRTSNFLSLVMNGKRNLTVSSIASIARGFGLPKQEWEYFETLVLMNQAKTHEEKDHYYRKMLSAKGLMSSQQIGKASYEYFSTWYTPIVREIIALGDRNFTPEQIAGMLNPAITPAMAKKALDTLIQLNLIRQDANGLWEKCDDVITTGPLVRSLLALNYHKEMLKCAGEALGRFQAGQRDISAVVLSIKSSAMGELKHKIAQFRRELLEFACLHHDADQVVQVNLQAFPVTHPIATSEKKED